MLQVTADTKSVSPASMFCLNKKDGLTPDTSDDRILQIAQNRIPVANVYRPNTVGSNALIAAPTEHWETTRGWDFNVHRGPRTDSVVLLPGTAAWIKTADCLTIVARHKSNGLMAVAHASRESLFDRQRLSGGERRRYESVVNGIVDNLGNKPRKLEVWIGFGIGPAHFEHRFIDPKYGKWNRQMIDFFFTTYGPDVVFGDLAKGRLDLRALARSQFKLLGVPDDAITTDEVDTASDPNYFSRRAGDPTGHNNIFVINNG